MKQLKMQFHKYFSKNELQFVYLLFRHYTHLLPPRDVVLSVLELRVKVVVKDEGQKSVHTEKDGRKHGLEQKNFEKTWKNGKLDGLEQWWYLNEQKNFEKTWKNWNS